MLSDAVDALGDSVVIVDGKEQRFRQFYSERIDAMLQLAGCETSDE
jgi:hypothetical protein